MNYKFNLKKFTWCGLDQTGQRISGISRASNLNEVQSDLLQRSIAPLQICEKVQLSIAVWKQGIPKNFIVDFSQQLSTLVNANIPLVTALGIMQYSCTSALSANFILCIKNEIEKGKSLSRVLKTYPGYFNKLFCNLVLAGERSGTLDLMLKYIAAYYEKNQQQQRKIKKILLYPLFVLLIAMVITIVLLIFIIPQFQQMFASFGATLPVYTQFIINLASTLKSNGIAIFSIIILIILSVLFIKKKNSVFSAKLDYWLLHFPYFGIIVQKALIARIARILSITFRAGLPLHEALDLVSEIITNNCFYKTMCEIKNKIMQGKSLHVAMNSSKLFPQRVLQLITIGEESGTLDDMLGKIADYYDAEVNYVTDNLQNLLEPMIIIILGILVGGLVIGMYLPIFQIGKIM